MSTLAINSNRNSGGSGSLSGLHTAPTAAAATYTLSIISKRLFAALLPSFISDAFGLATTNETGGHSQRRRRTTIKDLHSTAYLDGLRGLAACSVFAYHYTDYNHKFFLPFYGYHNKGDDPEIASSFMQLPFVRLVYSGTPMVHVFFVISGFALSLRPLQCLYSSCQNDGERKEQGQGQAKAHSLIVSGCFRRPIRLFIPPLGATALAAFVVYFLGWMPTFLKPEETLWGQVADWVDDAVHRVMWPWAWDDMSGGGGSPHSRYNPHLWTIPMEFVHSMLLFLVLMVLVRLRGPRTRKIVLVGLMGYTLFICTRWAAFEFLAGALLAEMHLGERFESESRDVGLPGHGSGHLSSGERGKEYRYGRLKKVVQIAVLVASAYLLCWPPRKDDMTPTFEWIQSMAPSSYGGGDKGKNFWLAVAALGTVWSVGKIGFIKTRILGSCVAQYAGRISFCLYIFQHLILNLMQHHTLGSEYKPATETREEEMPWGVRGTFGISSTLQRTVTWWVGLVIMGFLLVCLADFGTRMLDGPAVRLAKTVEGLAFGSSTGLEGHSYQSYNPAGERAEDDEKAKS